MKLLILSILLCSSFAVANETATEANNDCVMQSRIRSYQSNDPTSLTIDAGRQDYQMIVSYCSELPWAQRIGFRSFSGNRVCRGDRLLVLDNFSNRIIQECLIRRIEKI